MSACCQPDLRQRNTAGNTTYTDTVTLTAQPRRFLRLVVTAP